MSELRHSFKLAGMDDADKAAAVQQQMLDAHAVFERNIAERQFFLELDAAARVEPTALVGRQIRVLWPEDDAWYLARVTAYDPATAEHMVRLPPPRPRPSSPVTRPSY